MILPASENTSAIDGEAFAAEAERITNHALLDEWLSLYHEDAIAEWIFDGARERHEGLREIRPAATVLAKLWAEHGLVVKKKVECVSADTVVLTWHGGFHGGHRQFGTEIWTLTEGQVVRHQMYGYLDVRAAGTLRARLRLLLASPRITLSLRRHMKEKSAA